MSMDLAMQEALFHAVRYAKRVPSGPSEKDQHAARVKLALAQDRVAVAKTAYHGITYRDMDAAQWRLV